MPLSTKALFAALALSITPALASAQAPNSYVIPNIGAPSLSNATGSMPHLVQMQQSGQPDGRACGAYFLQGLLVGQPVALAETSGLAARYFTPDSRGGTADYQPQRLNIETDDTYIITRVYCG